MLRTPLLMRQATRGILRGSVRPRSSPLHTLRIARPAGGRTFCTAAETKAGESGESMSMGKRVGIFTAFMVVGGGATFAYMLVSDTDFLFQVRDVSPALVNAIAPWIGLPVEEETGELDVEEFMPRDIQDIVGDKLKVACTLRSGKVCLVDAAADASMEELQALVSTEMGEAAPEIVQVDFVNEDEVAALETADEAMLQKSFGIIVPEIPASATKKQLKDLLDQCRLLGADLQVQLELSKKYNNDTSQILRAMEETEERKKEIKRRLRRRF